MHERVVRRLTGRWARFGWLARREHLFELAILVPLVLACEHWLERMLFQCCVIIELTFAVATTKTLWKQFATQAQTEWAIASGVTARRELARNYWLTLALRSGCHALVWLGVIAWGTPDGYHAILKFGLNEPALTASVAWIPTVRVALAAWHTLAGSRRSPRVLRESLAAPLCNWGDALRHVLVVAVLGCALVLLAASVFYPLGAVLQVTTTWMLLLALLRQAEPVATNAEFALVVPRFYAARSRLRAAPRGDGVGLLWHGTKGWWRWLWLPLAAMTVLLALGFDPPGVSWRILAAMVVCPLLTQLAGATRQSRSKALRLGAGFVIGVVLIVGLGLASDDSSTLKKHLAEVYAGSLAYASPMAAAFSPYRWSHTARAEDDLAARGIALRTLHRIELTTGLVLAAVSFGSVAFCARDIVSHVPFGVGGILAAVCLLASDYRTDGAGTWKGSLSSLRMRPLAIVCWCLMVAFVCSAASAPDRVLDMLTLAIVGTALIAWGVAWGAGGRAQSPTIIQAAI